MQLSPLRGYGRQVRPMFGNEQSVQQEGAQTDTKKQAHKEYVDPLLTWPMRGLGYTNDLGVAISEVAPKLSVACWIPALMYFGADIYDKYKNKGDEYNPNGQRALTQAIFQAVASVAFPFVVGHFGSSVFSSADKFVGDRLSSNAKEQTLDDIKAFVGRNNVYGKDVDENAMIDKFKKELETSYTHKKDTYESKNFFTKFIDYTLGGCEKGAIPNADKEKLLSYGEKMLKKMKSERTNTEGLIKLAEKEAFKLKVWKSIGSFAALLSTVKFIDNFTENVIIHKCVEPGLEQINHTNHNKKEQEA